MRQWHTVEVRIQLNDTNKRDGPTSHVTHSREFSNFNAEWSKSVSQQFTEFAVFVFDAGNQIDCSNNNVIAAAVDNF